MITVKPWWKSKTVWANLILLVALVVEGQTGFNVSVEEQGALIVFVNLVLRAITTEGLSV